MIYEFDFADLLNDELYCFTLAVFVGTGNLRKLDQVMNASGFRDIIIDTLFLKTF